MLHAWSWRSIFLLTIRKSFSNFIRKPTQSVPSSFTERLRLLCSEVLDIVKEEGPLLIAKDSTASPVLQVRFTPLKCPMLILITRLAQVVVAAAWTDSHFISSFLKLFWNPDSKSKNGM